MRQKTTRRRTIGVMIFHCQTIQNVCLGDQVEAGNAEAIETGLVFDTADFGQRRQE